jgi:hypothetical protein
MTGRREGLQRIEKDTLGGSARHPTWAARLLSANPAIALQAFSDTPWRMAAGRYYFSRKRRIRRRTEEYIAGVTRPVCVFCWLG